MRKTCWTVPDGINKDKQKQADKTKQDDVIMLIKILTICLLPGSCDWACPVVGKVLRTVRLPSPIEDVGVAYITV